MNKFKVIIEHDRFSRKPIHISFKVSFLDFKGNVLHSIDFKSRSFLYGIHAAHKRKRMLENPVVQFGIVAAEMSNRMGFKFDTTKNPDSMMEQVFENASVEFLEEYLKKTKNERDIAFIQNELKKRGELS